VVDVDFVAVGQLDQLTILTRDLAQLTFIQPKDLLGESESMAVESRDLGFAIVLIDGFEQG
jgi:hypothetical protein